MECTHWRIARRMELSPWAWWYPTWHSLMYTKTVYEGQLPVQSESKNKGIRHQCVCGFSGFFCLFLLLLLLKSSNSPGWSDRMHGTISVSLLRLFLWLIMWKILGKVPWGGGKEVYFVLVWNILQISVKSAWFIISINFGVSVFSVCVNVLSISESRVLKSLSIIV